MESKEENSKKEELIVKEENSLEEDKEEEQKEANDKFSSDEDDFQVNVDLRKNTTNTSNFKFDIELVPKNSIDIKNKTNSFSNKKVNPLKDISKIEGQKGITEVSTENNKKFEEDLKESDIPKEEAKDGQKPEDVIEGSSNEDSENEDSKEKIEKSCRTTKEFLKTTNIFSFYEKLRERYEKTKKLFVDPDFPCEASMFADIVNVDESEFDIKFERPIFTDDSSDFFKFESRQPQQKYNIKDEFKINKGLMNDKCFLSAMLMLFKQNEEYFSNLIVDFEHAEENVKAGFCGFTFFIDGEWKIITVDTRIPKNYETEVLSSSSCSKAPYWISLFEKAYAKAFGSYSVLNYLSVKDFLVDFTAGWSKKVPITKIDKDADVDDKTKNYYFNELTRLHELGYLVGCMKYNEKTIGEFGEREGEDDNDEEEEKIIENSLYVVLDIKEFEGTKLIFIVNRWKKGKYTDLYHPEDELWESNKRLKETLNYTPNPTDGTTWMPFDFFLKEFNTLYYSRIFPEEWSQYNIAGIWKGETSGGAPQKDEIWYPIPKEDKQKGGLGRRSCVDSKKNKLIGENSTSKFLKITSSNIGKKDSKKVGLNFGKKFGALDESKNLKGNSNIKKSGLNSSNTNNQTIKTIISSESIGGGVITKEKKEPIKVKCPFNRTVIVDTDDCFFLNPQYKIKIKEGTKLIISLMQEDQKVKQKEYLKCNFIIVISRFNNSRVWDLRSNHVIKKALDEKDDGKRREIVTKLDFYEIIKKYNSQNSKKLTKVEYLYVNLIPYIEFTEKYQIFEFKGNKQLSFKPYHPENKYWLRIFSNKDIFIKKLKMPHQCTVAGVWKSKDINLGTCDNQGGRRILANNRTFTESKSWQINPQYLIKFEKNLRTKIILRKTEGPQNAQSSKIGLMITRPRYYNEDAQHLEEVRMASHKKPEKEIKKLDQIQKVIKSTNKLLKTKDIDMEEIYPKLTINSSETVYESTYGNEYCASIQKSFNKLESPSILIPTLDSTDEFNFELNVYSTEKLDLVDLYGNTCISILGEWNEQNAGGSHLDKEKNEDLKNNSDDENSKNKGYKVREKRGEDEEKKKRKIRFDENPKFLLEFESKDWIKNLKFEIILSRSESLWKRSLSLSMINSMMSCYIFKNEREKWKSYCMNLKDIDFMPKNDVIIKYFEEKADPKGYILMPVTYGKGVYGPFNLLVRCDQKFRLSVYEEKKNENPKINIKNVDKNKNIQPSENKPIENNDNK